MNKTVFKFVLSSLPFLIVFLANLYRPYDADLGWHLKYGQYFFDHYQILRDNIFSTQMPDFHWSNSSWGADLISFSVFNGFGFLGLTILGASIVTLTFFFFAKAAKLSLWDKVLIFPVLFYLEEPINQVSFRGQMMSLLFMGMMYVIFNIYDVKKSKKSLLLLIPLFLIWANIHGEFLLGLGLFLGWIILYLFQQILNSNFKNIKSIFEEGKFLGIIFLLAALATLINPFGVGVYADILTHIGNPQLKNIIEYLPFDKFSTLWWNHLITGALLLFGVIYYVSGGEYKRKIPEIGLALFLFLLALEIRRYGWPAYYFALPLLKPLSSMFEPSSKKIYYPLALFFLAIFLGFVIKTKLPFNQFSQMSWQIYCKEYVHCSDPSAQFLVNNNFGGNLLTFYDWGGWLIWNYPEVKPSIDGRMHLWKDANGYSSFENYYLLEQNLEDIDSSKYDVVLMSPDKPVYKKLIKLVNQGKWKLLYQDKVSGVFSRNSVKEENGSL